ncbi:hypothetical protein GCM10017056_06040 [Seohaeicola zhoushanensis]|uniref:Flagellar hook-length control protein-like C-terminal domain-containing protein n=2 Tax=Seohaeicola zhoushanensis TaxID=1569283 RepID=A0A8J3GUZ7_9RHOB|nr:hypothetical protein GCM10017056_06040 [Seohaeicola zhoushanensis]
MQILPLQAPLAVSPRTGEIPEDCGATTEREAGSFDGCYRLLADNGASLSLEEAGNSDSDEPETSVSEWQEPAACDAGESGAMPGAAVPSEIRLGAVRQVGAALEVDSEMTLPGPTLPARPHAESDESGVNAGAGRAALQSEIVAVLPGQTGTEQMAELNDRQRDRADRMPDLVGSVDGQAERFGREGPAPPRLFSGVPDLAAAGVPETLARPGLGAMHRGARISAGHLSNHSSAEPIDLPQAARRDVREEPGGALSRLTYWAGVGTGGDAQAVAGAAEEYINPTTRTHGRSGSRNDGRDMGPEVGKIRFTAWQVEEAGRGFLSRSNHAALAPPRDIGPDSGSAATPAGQVGAAQGLSGGFRLGGGSVPPPEIAPAGRQETAVTRGGGDVSMPFTGGLTLALPSESAPVATHSAAQPAHSSAPSGFPAAQTVAALLRQPDGQIELAVDPEELGPVRMTLRATEGAISVVISGDRAETLDLMRRHIDGLAQEFRRQGFDSIGFEFRQSGSGDRGATPRQRMMPHEIAEMEEPARPTTRFVRASLDIRI